MKKTDPVVTVIIPTFNRRDLLEKSIDSVLAQTFTGFELLVCDDGSSDGSKEMVEGYNDKRVMWLSGQHSGGPSNPRNKGINHARGEWLAFLDSDDLWEAQKLERQLEIAEQVGCDSICSNAFVMKEEKILKDAYFRQSRSRIITFRELLDENHVICSSMMTRKDLAVSAGYFPEGKKLRVGEDYALWLSMAMIGSIYYTSDKLVKYKDEPEVSLRGNGYENEFIGYHRVIVETLINARGNELIETNKIIIILSVYFKKILRNPVKFFRRMVLRRILRKIRIR